MRSPISTYKAARARLAAVVLFLFSFRGRLGNAGYVLYYIFLVVMAQAYKKSAASVGGFEALSQTGGGSLMIFGFSLLVVSGVAAMTRRLHDVNLRGWWAVGVAVLAWLLQYKTLIYLFCVGLSLPPGTSGINRFGRAPWSAWRAVQAMRLRRAERDYADGKIDTGTFNARRAALLPKN